LERRGVPTVVLASSAFYPKALHDCSTLGLPDARVAEFTHPLGGLSDEQLLERAAKLHDGVLRQLKKVPPQRALEVHTASASRLLAPADPADLQLWFFERHLSDGFPVIAPTAAAVAEMVKGSRRSSGDLVGIVAPRLGVATVEQIAINAVMAGCRPQHMPVLITAVEAMLEPRRC
jgi:hypothetical protein